MANVKESVEYSVSMNNKDFVSGAKENSGSMDKMNGKLKISKGAILGIGTATVGAVAGLFKMADMASDLDESMNVINSTLGKSADDVIKWSETSIEAMGISQTEALKTAGIYSSIGSAMGINDSLSAKYSKSLTQLSADMASFYNVGQDVSANALKGVFTGETESLKQFGIILNDSTLKQYGYNSSMSESEKVAIRYKAVMEQTKAVQGDFSKTSDGLANQTRILVENFKQLLTVVGQKLVPIFEKVIGIINSGLSIAIDILSGKAGGLGGIFSQLAPIFQMFGNIVTGVANIFMIYFIPILQLVGTFLTGLIGVVVQVSQTIVTLFAPTIQALGIVFTNLAQAIAPVIVALKNLLIPAFNILTSVIETVLSVLSPLINFIIVNVVPGITLLANVISTVLVVVINVLTTVLSFLAPIFNVIANVMKVVANVINQILAVAFVFLQGIVEVVSSVLRGISGVFNKVGEVAGKLASIISGTLKKAFDVLLTPINAVSTAIETLIGWIQSALGAIGDFFDSLSEKASNIPLIGRFFDTPSVGVGAGNQTQTVNNYNFEVNYKNTSSYREAYRTGMNMVSSGGRSL